MRHGLTAFLVAVCYFGPALGGETSGIKENMEFVRVFARTGDVSGYIHALKRIGKDAREMGNRLEALRFFREILSSHRHLPLHVYIRLEMARFHSGPRRESLLLHALHQTRDDHSQAAALHELIRFYDQRSQLDAKKLYLQRLVKISASSPDIPGIAGAYRDLGMMDLRNLDAVSALRSFLRALNHRSEPDVVGEASLGAAVALGMMNKPDLQERYFQRALDYAQRWNLKPLKVRALSRYGQTLLEQENYAEALRIVNLSVAEERKLSHYVCLRDSLFRRGLILERLGSKSQVEASLAESVRIALKHQDLEGLLPVMAFLADTWMQKRQFEKSRELLLRIDDLFAPYHPHYFLFEYLQGRQAQLCGDNERAASAYARAADQLRRHLPSFRFSFHSFWRDWLDTIFSRMIRFRLDRFSASKDPALLESAVRLHEERNDLLAQCIVSLGSRDLALQREEDYLLQHLDRLLKRSLKTRSAERLQEQMQRLRRQYQQMQELRMTAAPLAPAAEPYRLDLDRLRRSLDPQQLIVKFMLLENRIAVVTLGRQCLRFRYLDSFREAVVADVLRLAEPLNDFARGKVDYLRVHFDLPLALSLFRRLLQPVMDDLRDTKEVIVIPDGELFHLPFDALVSGFSPQKQPGAAIFSEYTVAEYLIQRFQFSLAANLSRLQRKFSPMGKPAADLVAFSGPLIPPRKDPGLSADSLLYADISPLPATVAEVGRISRLFAPGRVLTFTGEAFTISNFRRHAPGARILHLATHYIPNLDSPWHSALVFSPDRALKDESFLLRANDAQHIPLQAELLVLSACESSDQRILGIRGLSGMAAAFSANGVRSALVSMWPVDEISSRVLPDFYRQYLLHGHASQALRRAKLEFMQSEIRLSDGKRMSFAHPFFWSNFQLLRFRR